MRDLTFQIFWLINKKHMQWFSVSYNLLFTIQNILLLTFIFSYEKCYFAMENLVATWKLPKDSYPVNILSLQIFERKHFAKVK